MALKVHPLITFDVRKRRGKSYPALYITFGNESLETNRSDEFAAAKWLAKLGYPYIEALNRIRKALGQYKPDLIKHVGLSPHQIMFLMELRIEKEIHVASYARYEHLATEKLVRERLIVADRFMMFKFALTDKGQRYVEYLCNGNL